MSQDLQGLAVAALFFATLSGFGCAPGDSNGNRQPVHSQSENSSTGAGPVTTFDRGAGTDVSSNVMPAAASGAAAGANGATPKIPSAAAASGIPSAPSSSGAGSAGASAAPAAPSTNTNAGTTTGKTVWKPQPGVTWQWQLTGTVDTSLDVQMYDIDMFTNSPAVIQKLHADKRVVICYFSAGSYEPSRPDSATLANTDLGSVLDGWPDERWVDIRSPAVRTVMQARLDFAVKQGCDGVEPDNVDGFDNANGLGLTAQDQIDFNRFLAKEAHARGLSIGLKNTLGLVPNLVGSFDWALNEECEQFGECTALQPFIAAGKAVFHCEYVDSTASAADTGTDLGSGTGVIPGAGVTPAPGLGTGTPASGSTPSGNGAEMDADEAMNEEMDEDVDTEMDADVETGSDVDTGSDGDAEDGDSAAAGDDEMEAEAESDTDTDDSDADAEYSNVYAITSTALICASNPAGFSTIIKNLDLDAFRLTCN